MKKTIQEAFTAQVKTCPNKIALMHGEHSISYKELNERSNQVANHLKQLGLEKNSVIGVCLDRGFDLIVSIIGVLKAGHTYLPLDPSYPVSRLRYMHEHSQASAILCDPNNLNLFTNTDNLIDVTKINTSKEDYVVAGDNVYVIYTSGSTGVPKGVLLGQACLSNLLNWQSRNVKNGTTLQFAPVSFDVHFQEIFGTLLSGHTLYLVSEKQRKNLLDMLKAIEANDIKRVFLPFVALEQICKLAMSNDLYPTCLEEVVTAGEQLRVNDNIREFFKETKARLHNHYGPSETHVCVAKTLSADVSSWPSLPAIGVSIDGAKTLVLDQDMNQVPEGELYVGGTSVAEGYIHDESRTSERFIKINNEIYYKTGDLVRTNMEGELEFVARIDGQVKISGHRIELGEIENCAQQAFPSADICSTVKTLENGEKVICVYVCGEHCEKTLKEHLRESLPEYMLPKFVVAVDSFPLTPSGKLNREELPMPKIERGDLASEYEAPKNSLEKEIAEIWKGLLSIDEVGVNDKFFDLGGTSLLAMDLVEKLKTLRPNISAVELFEAATVRQQACLIKPKKLKNSRTIKQQGGTDIAIVSMTGRFPGANSIDELWEMLSSNKEGIEKFSADQLHPSIDRNLVKNKNYVLASGEYKDCKRFDAAFFGMTPREAELMDPQQRKFLELNWEALELAGINPNKCEEVIGIFAGCANNTYQNNLSFHKDKIDEFGEFNVMLANEKDYIATRIAYKLNLKGPAVSIHTGCSTSLVAIAQAVQAIRNGQCDMALAGGISIDGQLKTGYMHQEGAIYSSDGSCRPYSSNATGTVFTNGAGVVTLMPKELAIERGQEILGIIKGVGINNDGNDKMSFTAPSIQGQTDAIIMAFDDANLSPEDVAYIEGHGTATPVGDPIEVAALSRAFESLGAAPSHNCFLGSIKSNVGHMTAAAGVAGVIKACLIFKHKLVPASIGIQGTNPNIDFEKSWFTPVQKNTSIKEGKLIGVSSFGVGGTNAHVLIQGPITKEVEITKSREELFFLSAKTEQALKSMQSKLDQTLKKTNHVDTSYTLCEREEFSFRTTRTSGSVWSPITKKADKQVVFMFPGQGSQYVGMGKELMEAFPSFRSDFEYCCEVASQFMFKDLKAVMLGDAREEDALNNTFYTQPAILIFEYCLGRLVQRFGIKASGYIGHSIGELCACVFNGVLSIEEAIEIVTKRSELMSGIEPGSMMSVALPKEGIDAILPESIQVAAVNSRQSTVVAGPTADIKKLEKELSADGVSTKLLHTSHAFHSKMMSPMVDEFKSFLTKFKFNPPSLPMISTVTGDLEAGHFCEPGYWAEHVARPVMFAPAIGKQINESNIFLEIGPRTTLRQLGMSEAVHKKVKTSFFSLSSQDTANELRAFLACLGKLWQEGIDFHKELLFEGRTPKITSTVTYEFGGKEYWLEANETTPINKENNTLDRGEKMQSAKTRLRDRIVEVIESASGIEIADFSDETSFFEMGMDSLFLTQIALKLKKEFKQEISFRQLTEQYDDVQKLTEFLADFVSMEEDSVPADTVETNLLNTECVSTSKVQNSDSGVDALVKEQLQIMKLQLEVLGNKVQNKPQPAQAKQVRPSRAVQDERAKEKKNFGAMAKISSDKSTLDEKSIEFIKTFITKYNAKTSRSKAFTQENRKIHSDPRVVTGFKPESKEMVYPIVTKSSVGQKLIDLDGNEYVDMLCGFGSNFFGNNNREINEAIKRQIDIGMEIGPQSPLVSEVASLISELTGNERSAFCNTGSEAVLGAMRVARTVSGRETIVCFSGSYHGINDEVIVRASSSGKSLPAAPGVHSSSVKEMVVLDYGTDESFEKIKSLCEQGELAAVLVEPVQSRRCDFHPKEFLQKLRTLTEQHDVCLIFDEVITGFRIHPGGAQAHFDVRADLCTYGKIVGGGMPIGVLSGKSKYMDALDGGHWEFGDDSIPTVGVTYFAGTFVRHPLALAAAKKALEIIKREGTQGLSDLNHKTQQWVDDINSYCEAVGSNLRFANFGSLVKPKWLDGDYIHSDLFFANLRMHGVHQYDGFPWFINLAHTQTELDFVKDVIKQVVTELQVGGVMPSNGRELKTDQMNCLSPPVLGAKLGKDKNGNPGWFIPHPEKQGQYYQLQ